MVESDSEIQEWEMYFEKSSVCSLTLEKLVHPYMGCITLRKLCPVGEFMTVWGAHIQNRNQDAVSIKVVLRDLSWVKLLNLWFFLCLTYLKRQELTGHRDSFST